MASDKGRNQGSRRSQVGVSYWARSYVASCLHRRLINQAIQVIFLPLGPDIKV
ncbi:hypothetical protein DPMN_061420 [Dreissena polymorpha]|uniref:Uncharacterized protein n=1 Tax=Dreissena polymorpha TaxID=45954 RepID=A0A9D4C7N2_DREPO|nr:hypothetical protein DPMN_061420 [Dreissena polymorpha]